MPPKPEIRARRTFLSRDFLDTSQSGRVHSVFKHSANIEAGNRLITVSSQESAENPDSIEIGRHDTGLLSLLEIGSSAKWDLNRFTFDKFSILVRNGKYAAPNFDNKFPPKKIASPTEVRKRLKGLKFVHELNAREESLLRELIGAAGSGNDSECASVLRKAIGLGGGMTPSMDDAIAGVMAVVKFFEVCGKNLAGNFIESVCRESENRTTDISRKYFFCAAEGRFSMPIIKTVMSIFAEGEKLDTASVQRLLEFGHTSGRDTLRGIFLAAEKFK